MFDDWDIPDNEKRYVVKIIKKRLIIIAKN